MSPPNATLSSAAPQTPSFVCSGRQPPAARSARILASPGGASILAAELARAGTATPYKRPGRAGLHRLNDSDSDSQTGPGPENLRAVRPSLVLALVS